MTHDEIGNPIPAHMWERYARNRRYKKMADDLKWLEKMTKSHRKEYVKEWSRVPKQLECDLRNAVRQIEELIPHCVCPTCGGREGVECRLCAGLGYISKWKYSHCVPAELKKMQ